MLAQHTNVYCLKSLIKPFSSGQPFLIPQVDIQDPFWVLQVLSTLHKAPTITAWLSQPQRAV